MPVFRERVLPSAANLILPLLLFPSVVAVMLPLAPSFALPVATLITLLFCTVVFYSSPVVTFDGQCLTAKNAVLPKQNIGQAAVIEKSKIFEEMGQNLDARAWLSIQASVKGLVKVEVKDPNDPTPYWLISSRKPEELAKILNQR